MYQADFFDKETLNQWGDFLAIGIPTTLLNCVEWWAFEFIVIFAGTMG